MHHGFLPPHPAFRVPPIAILPGSHYHLTHRAFPPGGYHTIFGIMEHTMSIDQTQNTEEQQQVVSAIPEKPSTPLIDIADFMKVTLRVGCIIAVEPVAKSKKLLKLQVDMGPELGARQIVSGIAQYYTSENLLNKRIIVVANLKPAQLMGVESNGMLLAGASEDGTTLAIVEPHEALPLGSIVR